MKIVVTGGAGFIASHIVDKLIEKEHKVLVVDNLSTGDLKNLNQKAEFKKNDIRDKDLLIKIFEEFKPSAVFHLAAQIDVRKSVEEPDYDASINIIGTINVLEAMRKSGCKKIIFASSGGAIYGDADVVPTPETYNPKPMSAYGTSKLCGEEYIKLYSRLYGFVYQIMRFSNVYGPRQKGGEAGVYAIFEKKMKAGERPIIFGDGKQIRDYIHVNKVAEFCVKSLDFENSDIYNVGTGKGKTVLEVFEEIKQKTGFKGEPIFADAKKGDVRRSVLDVRKMTSLNPKDYEI